MTEIDTTRIHNKSSTKLTQKEIDSVAHNINTTLSPPQTQELIMHVGKKQIKATIMTVIRLVNLEDV